MKLQRNAWTYNKLYLKYMEIPENTWKHIDRNRNAYIYTKNG